MNVQEYAGFERIGDHSILSKKNSKWLCLNCTDHTRSPRFHKCVKPLTRSIEVQAWLGDARYALMVRTKLRERGWGPEISHSLCANILSSEFQTVLYAASSFYEDSVRDMSVHKQSQFFEALYEDDLVFRDFVDSAIDVVVPDAN